MVGRGCWRRAGDGRRLGGDYGDSGDDFRRHRVNWQWGQTTLPIVNCELTHEGLELSPESPESPPLSRLPLVLLRARCSNFDKACAGNALVPCACRRGSSLARAVAFRGTSLASVYAGLGKGRLGIFPAEYARPPFSFVRTRPALPMASFKPPPSNMPFAARICERQLIVECCNAPYLIEVK
jgi:hypothetical protein